MARLLARALRSILKGRLGFKTGLFNANAPLLSDLNLLFQIAIFIFLVVGLLVVKLRPGFMKHGVLMGIALVFNTVSIGVVMVPSFLSFRALFSMLFTRTALIVIGHTVIGGLAEILGIWLVGTWIFAHQEIKTCVKKKNTMRITILLWLVELFLGMYVYTMLYLPNIDKHPRVHWRVVTS